MSWQLAQLDAKSHCHGVSHGIAALPLSCADIKYRAMGNEFAFHAALLGLPAEWQHKRLPAAFQQQGAACQVTGCAGGVENLAGIKDCLGITHKVKPVLAGNGLVDVRLAMSALLMRMLTFSLLLPGF
jgi:hypothetical protein